jgi:hypothetical protein
MIDVALAAALMLGVASGQAATAPAYTRSQAEQDLRGVIETFRTSIIRKDKAAFLALFHNGPVVWQGVDSDALVAKRGRRAGVDAKAAFDSAQNPRSFIEGIANEKARSEERFDNVDIDTDGDVASITFDFAYLLDDRPINLGKESWHLVRSESGWKIVSVIYSNRDPA